MNHLSDQSDGDLTVLRVIGLKGRADVPSIAAAATVADERARAVVDDLAAEGYCSETNMRVRLTPEGRDRLNTLLDRERAQLNRDAILGLYDEFNVPNAKLKDLAKRWQLRDEQPNDHTDAAYDQEILDGLAEVDRCAADLLSRLVAVVPRLSPYPLRLAAALNRVQNGDHSWFLHPLIDSYHTVWFELHEELIGLSGHERQAEAAAGRAE